MLSARTMEIFLNCQLEAQDRQKPFVFLMRFLFNISQKTEKSQLDRATQKHSTRSALLPEELSSQSLPATRN